MTDQICAVINGAFLKNVKNIMRIYASNVPQHLQELGHVRTSTWRETQIT